MDRKQAVVLVKELYLKCPHMEGKSIKLKQTDLRNPFSFEIEIRMGSYRLIKPYVIAISTKDNFSVTQNNDLLTISESCAKVPNKG